MKTRAKISIDRFVGLPLAWGLNLAARILGKTMRRDHTVRTENVRTIVFAKYLGMGSILQATPLVRSVRAAFPQAKIIFIVGQSCRNLVERLEHIDAVITVDDRTLFQVVRTSLRVIVTLIQARVDLYFDLEVYSAYASIMALLSLARNRVGFFRQSAEHKRGNYTHLMYFNTRHPIRYLYLQLGRLVGCQPVEPDRLGCIRVDDADRDELAGKLAAAGIEPRSYIVINPNASDLMIERRWPGERFAALIDGMAERFDCPVILIGTPSERPYVASVVAQVPSRGRRRVFNLAGDLSLGGLFALLDDARCVVTNDTGPMHMAWSLRTPTVCLFGPVDPAHYGWKGADVKVLYKRLYCSPCVHEIDQPPCQGNNVCMRRIGVAEVMEAVEQILTGTPACPARPIDPAFFSDEEARPLGRVMR